MSGPNDHGKKINPGDLVRTRYDWNVLGIVIAVLGDEEFWVMTSHLHRCRRWNLRLVTGATRARSA